MKVMDRRQFIAGSLAAPLIVRAASLDYVPHVPRRIFRNRTFYLSAPFVVDAGYRWTVEDCDFVALPDFSGRAVLQVEEGVSGAVFSGINVNAVNAPPETILFKFA